MDYIEAGGRCKQALYFHRHRCTNVKADGLGWRCKYCGKPLIKIRNRERRERRVKVISN